MTMGKQSTLSLLVAVLAMYVQTAYPQGPFNSGGKLTFYGGGLSGTACGYDSVPTASAPFGLVTAAGAHPSLCGQFIEIDTANACGGGTASACISDGLLNRGKVIVMVTDSCAECVTGHFDLTTAAFQALLNNPGDAGTVGVIDDVDWRFIHGQYLGNIRLQSRSGTSQFWYALNVFDHNETITQVEIKSSGSTTWVAYQQQPGGNFWVIPGGTPLPLVSPLSVRLTGSNGEVLTSDNVITNFNGNTQFDFGSNFTPPPPMANAQPAKTIPVLGWVAVLVLALALGGSALRKLF
ncbi:MAG: expansin C-terminal domain-related protein [Pseudomonadota bacterium]